MNDRAEVSEEPGGAGYDARLYALVHRGNPGDLVFYRRTCQGAKRVLELGCGDGRVLRALRAPGRELVGVDRHAGLLNTAREALSHPGLETPVQLLELDMREIDRLGRFDRVLIPYCGLLCLLTREAQLDCLKRARQVLVPEGWLAFDVYSADELHAAWLAGEERADDPSRVDDSPPEHRDWIATVYDDEIGYEVYESSYWLPEQQRLDVTYDYEAFEAATNKRRPDADRRGRIQQRYLLGSEIGDLLDLAGFRAPELLGGFFGEPLDDESEHIVAVASPRA